MEAELIYNVQVLISSAQKSDFFIYIYTHIYAYICVYINSFIDIDSFSDFFPLQVITR